MDIHRLEIFCRIIELKSFTRAAEATRLSQPTVSEHIRFLEETLGEKLLDRLGREVLPTQAGQILYRYARRIIHLRDEALQAIENHKGNLAGILVLGASTIPGAYILPPRIEQFQSAHPTIRISLRIADTRTITAALLQGEMELALIGARSREHQLECRDIFSDQLVLTLYPGHPWAIRSSVNLMELVSEPFLMREEGSGTRTVLTETLRFHGLDPAKLHSLAEIGSTEAIRQAVKARLGISILSSLSVREDLERGSLVSVPLANINITRPFYLVQRRNRALSPLAQSFLNHLLTLNQD